MLLVSPCEFNIFTLRNDHICLECINTIVDICVPLKGLTSLKKMNANEKECINATHIVIS